MRQLLSGVAVAALLAIGLPAIAQAAADDHSASAATTAPDSTGQTAKAKAKHVRREAAQQRHTSSPEDSMAEQLNQRELQQLGSSPAATSSGSSAQPQQ
jgi:hypothetical protein